MHPFMPNNYPTVGVEQEFHLIDPASGDLLPSVDSVWQAIDGTEAQWQVAFCEENGSDLRTLELEIARSENVDPSLRDTIMAELGSTLQTDHGSSWGDWALALDEYLAATQGLIRIN